MSTLQLLNPGSYFATEVSNALFKLSGASISISGGVATVTLASHLLSTGDQTTFSGVTGVTALNNDVWGPVTVTSSSVYTFPTALTGSPAGTIVQEKLYFFPAGSWFVVLGANGQVEYNPDNKYGAASAGGVSGGAGSGGTWRTLIAASASGYFSTDGYSVRFRENGTTATSYFARVN